MAPQLRESNSQANQPKKPIRQIPLSGRGRTGRFLNSALDALRKQKSACAKNIAEDNLAWVLLSTGSLQRLGERPESFCQSTSSFSQQRHPLEREKTDNHAKQNKLEGCLWEVLGGQAGRINSSKSHQNAFTHIQRFPLIRTTNYPKRGVKYVPGQ